MRVYKTKNGPILVVRDRHVHHGFTGALLVLAGIALAWHDGKDFPWLPERIVVESKSPLSAVFGNFGRAFSLPWRHA